MNALHRRQSGQSDLAQFAELMPTSIKNLVKAYGVYPEEGVRTMGTGQVVVPANKITEGDQVMQAFGLRPSEIGEAHRERERDYRLREEHTQAGQALNRRVKGLFASA